MEILLGLLFGLAFPISSGVFGWKWIKASKQLKMTTLKAERLEKDIRSLSERVSKLSKYEQVADAELEAQSIIQRAKQIAKELELDAYEMLENAKGEADSVKKEAQEKAKANREKAEEILQQAHEQADKILDIANQRAKEIAGDALEAKEKADVWGQKAKAMKNLIEGYGEEYLLSAKTLLDELAEDFSHKEAGVELKKARDFSKNLVKSDRAATCDYVEDYRRRTAIRFVLDAFNGKVDTALSKVKHDNYGKLEQEIKDAFGLVNGHGKAFRDARITEEYLEARLAELKWGVITQELRMQEREEQRRIKEEMREEERARREYEKAIKEAEKEERMLQKAMEEAQRLAAEATDDQRQQYEEQIAELQKKFEEAESRNQRALSMAQQTRRGHVYVISNVGSFGEHIYKIGLTRRLEPMDRVKELGDASVPFDFDVHAMIYAEDAPALEKELHSHFETHQVNKVNPRKEFFKVGISDIREIVDSRNIEAHWTMKAEAREYFESLAVGRKTDGNQGEPAISSEGLAEPAPSPLSA